MATDYGFLSQMVQGVNEGITAYQTVSKNKRDEQTQNLLNGFVKNPQTGELELTPEKKAEQKVKALQNQRIADASDPTSQYSQTQRDASKGLLGPSAAPFITDQMSAADIKDSAPLMMAAMKGDERKDAQQKTLDARRDAAREAAANRGLLKEQMNQKRNSDLSTKYGDSLKKDFDPDGTRAGNFGAISKTKLSAERIETLAKAFPDGNLDSRQIEELSLGLANMLSGGGGSSRAQVEGLLPHTWSGKTANIQEWLTSEPTGAGQQKFVERMLHTVEREKELANDQLNRIRESRLPFHKKMRDLDPDQFNTYMQSYGLDPNNYDPKTLLRIKNATTGGGLINTGGEGGSFQQDPKVKQYAEQNNLDYSAAQALLKKRGYKAGN